MDSSCRMMGDNPYRECRKRASIHNDSLGSMEKAAEMLGVSVSTLSNYELGVTIPPVDIIMIMADLYRAPQLRTMYCKNECLIGKNMPVATCAGGIESITLRIIDQMSEKKIKDISDKLIRIAVDGAITGEEAEMLKCICSELDEIVKTVWELKLLSERGCDDGNC